jgi:phosphoribosylamine---glycine ligase
LVYKLGQWKKQQKLKEPFIIQDFVDGIEMSADGWFGPNGFDSGWSESFEFKKLMPGNFGVNTGEMGTDLRFTKRSKLAR